MTVIAVPVLSPSWELLLILTAAGHSHDLDAAALAPLSRAMQSAAARLSESARLLGLTRRGLYLKLRRLGLDSRAEVDTG